MSGDLFMYRARRQAVEDTEQKTLQEWGSRIERLNSIESGLIEPQVSSSYSKGSAAGYAGFYHYLTTNDTSRRDTGNSKSGNSHPKRPTNFERWISATKKYGDQTPGATKSEGYGLIDSDEIKEIQRCFVAADTNGSGWLDCEGFKVFMSLRGAPITHLDARRLLKVIDHQSQRYISYDQVMYLVAHCGITTNHEVPMTADEFNRILKRMRHSSKEKEGVTDVWPQSGHAHPHNNRRPSTVQPQCSYNQCCEDYDSDDLRPRTSTIIRSSIPMDNSRSFFEEMATDVEVKANDERLYKEYRRELQRYGSKRRPDPPAEKPQYEGPPAWKNLVLHSQDPTYHVPPIVFKDLRRDWEVKINEVMSQESGQSYTVNKKSTRVKIGACPKGLPATALTIPGRPQPFVVTLPELQVQLDKIRKKPDDEKLADVSPAPLPLDGGEQIEVKTDLLFKAPAEMKESKSRHEVSTA